MHQYFSNQIFNASRRLAEEIIPRQEFEIRQLKKQIKEVEESLKKDKEVLSCACDDFGFRVENLDGITYKLHWS